MHISLRRGERIFINGAVIRFDRKVCIELLNDATFLLENHIIQPEYATSPLKQLYLTIQTILMAPKESDNSLEVSLGLIKGFMVLSDEKILISNMIEIRNYLESGRPFEALKHLRNLLKENSKCTAMWDIVLSNNHIEGEQK